MGRCGKLPTIWFFSEIALKLVAILFILYFSNFATVIPTLSVSRYFKISRIRNKIKSKYGSYKITIRLQILWIPFNYKENKSTSTNPVHVFVNTWTHFYVSVHHLIVHFDLINVNWSNKLKQKTMENKTFEKICKIQIKTLVRDVFRTLSQKA